MREVRINTKTKTCLVTVSDTQFSIATEVLLYSFHKYNPDFDGDVLIISDDGSEKFRSRLRQISPVRFELPDPRLQQAVDKLQQADPRLKNIYRRLFSLEIFRLEGYDRVVYLDSDMYCSGELSELFTRTEDLLACPDGFDYGDRLKEALDLTEIPRASERYGKPFNTSFNAGVLSVGKANLNDDTYTRLLEMLDPQVWIGLGASKFTDQLALNVFFEGRFTPLHGRFNYMVFLEQYQKCLDQLSLLDARLVHFAGAIKPWNCYDPLQLATRAPQFIKFIDVWRELLEEARWPDDEPGQRELIELRLKQQQEWIRKYNEEVIEPTGRLC